MEESPPAGDLAPHSGGGARDVDESRDPPVDAEVEQRDQHPPDSHGATHIDADVKEVGKVYALEISTKAPAGTWFLGEDGKWVQKK